jgi:hypothetical protein
MRTESPNQAAAASFLLVDFLGLALLIEENWKQPPSAKERQECSLR